MEIRGRKRFRTKAERRQIVEETLKPGISVSQVARAHDVNTNQVFHWRRQYREGRLDEGTNKPTALVPVKLTGAVEESRMTTRRGASKAGAWTGLGIVEIDLGHARVHIEGAADPACVRAALQGLIR